MQAIHRLPILLAINDLCNMAVK